MDVLWNQSQRVILLTTSQNRADLEAKLLKKMKVIMHIEVISPMQYALRLLFRNHHFDVCPLTSKTKYKALLETFKQKNWPLDSALMTMYLEAFERLGDVQKVEDVCFRPLSKQKMDDLYDAYRIFKGLIGKECFDHELYRTASAYKEEGVTYYYVLPPFEFQGLQDFLKALDARPLPLTDKMPSLTSCTVQFKYQEYDYIIKHIHELVNQGVPYGKMGVYFSNAKEVVAFAHRCPFPINIELTLTQERDLDLMTACVEGRLEKKDLLNSLSPAAKAALADINDEEEDTFRYLLPFYIPSQETAQPLSNLNRIDVLTYQNPAFCKEYDHVFFANLAEDEFPSKIADQELLSNEELRLLYRGKSHLDTKNQKETALFNKLLTTTKHAFLICHTETLDGKPVLPSLLFKKYTQQATVEVFGFQPVPEVPLLIQNDLQPDTLSAKTIKRIYSDHLSASQLETYNSCPFKHFIRYGLGLKPKVGILERKALYGSLMHHLLDVISEPLSQAFEVEDSMDETLERLYEVNIQPLIEKMDLHEVEDAYLLYEFKKKCLNVMKMILVQEEAGDFRLFGHEYALDQMVDGYRYIGSIDRAELYQDYIKIIDYKSTNKSLDLGLCLQGFNIQMLLYLELLSRQLDKRKGAVVYFNTTDPCLQAKVSMEKDQLEARIEGEGLTDASLYIKKRSFTSLMVDDQNHEVAYAMDHDYTQSNLYGTRYVKSTGELKGPLITKEGLDALLQGVFDHLNANIKQCFDEGNIAIQPAGSNEGAVHRKVNPCTYCDYQAVCMRDPFYHHMKEVKNVNKEELQERLGGVYHESGE